MKRILAAFVALTAMGTAANAFTLAAGALYGAFDQKYARCYLFNAGDWSVEIEKAQIIDDYGKVLSAKTNTCTGTLAKLKSCYTEAELVGDRAYSCKMVVKNKGRFPFGEFLVRGGLEIINSDNWMIANLPLQ